LSDPYGPKVAHVSSLIPVPMHAPCCISYSPVHKPNLSATQKYMRRNGASWQHPLLPITHWMEMSGRLEATAALPPVTIT